MRRYAIFLRAVTPSGKNKVPMSALRDALEDVGLVDVRTYIQSGNVLARSDLTKGDLELLVRDVIADRIGPDLVVIARPASRIPKIVAEVPFGDADTSRLHITLLGARPAPQRVRDMLDVDLGDDLIEISGDTIYTMYASSEGLSRFNLGYFERSLSVAGTTRSHNTMSALARLVTDR
jgi:uncharacterized protein (DUF1697 family)